MDFAAHSKSCNASSIRPGAQELHRNSAFLQKPFRFATLVECLNSFSANLDPCAKLLWNENHCSLGVSSRCRHPWPFSSGAFAQLGPRHAAYTAAGNTRHSRKD